MSERLGDMGEFPFIARITKHLPARPEILEPAGDDCAVVRVGVTTLLVSCDAAVEEVHFSFATASPQDIGWRSATAAISDIGAMGGAPLFLTVALALPADTAVTRAEELFQGIAEAAEAYGAGIIGGDTTRSPGGVFLDITVIGAAGERVLLRRGALDGDLLAVTGFPGCAAAGLLALQRGLDAPALVQAHLRPQARIREGQWLAKQPQVHALIDVSDGLAQDAGHLAEASQLGIDIDLERLPVSSALSGFAPRAACSAEELILAGGEDYELALAIAPSGHAALCEAFQAQFGLPLTVIGRFGAGWSGVLFGGQPCTLRGFQHFT